MLTIIAIIAVGWIGGNIVNYLADYLPLDRKIVAPYCLKCKHPKWLLHYILFPKRCSQCLEPVRKRHWAVNIVSIAMSFYFLYLLGTSMSFWQAQILMIYFLLVIVVDIEHRLILHVVSFAGAVLGLVIGTSLHGIASTLLGGLAGLLIMFVLYQGGGIFLKLLAKWRDYSDIDEALGFGDVMLSGVLGLILGWPGIVLGLVLAVIIAGVTSLLYLVYLSVKRSYKPNLTVAYGPYLIISAMILIYFNNFIKQLL